MKSAERHQDRQAVGGIHYQVTLTEPQRHLYHIRLHIAKPAATQVLRLPVWIPGSYLVREFAKHVQGMVAQQKGRACQVLQSDKTSWRVDCDPSQPLELHYAVYAFDNSVRTAWLDAGRGFFNGTSLFLQTEGQLDQPHTIDIAAPDDLPTWQVATGLSPVKISRRGFGLYRAPDYDTLVDCPVEMGPFWSGEFSVRGVPHRFVVAGAAESFDGERLLRDTQTICEQEMLFWHGKAGEGGVGMPPFSSYVFMLNAVHDGYGGLEHGNSTALICPRKDLPRKPAAGHKNTKASEGYTTLLGLISHEYFHTWNVKRLRPAEFARYDYTQENYTELLWFFEGFTSYYDDLLLRRAGLIDDATYLRLLGKTINQVMQAPGRKVQSVAQASFDAWIKYYRPDENTANATISYYTKGALVALCLDLTLREEGKTTLDAVMRDLWEICAGGPMTEQQVRDVLQQRAGRSFAKELKNWVHGIRDLPLKVLLERHGLTYHEEPDALAQQLGLRVKESNGLTVQQVLRGSPAEKAGFAAGDEWLAVRSSASKTGDFWRLQTLDELKLYCGEARSLEVMVARDRRMHTLHLRLLPSRSTVRLTVRDTVLVSQWLG